MRVLTVRQPWAWAIIHGGKDVENRTRNLAGSYRGPVAIHAALREDVNAFSDMASPTVAALDAAADQWLGTLTAKQVQRLHTYPWSQGHGSIIGVADVVAVHDAGDCYHASIARAANLHRFDREAFDRLPVTNSGGGLIGRAHFCSSWAEPEAWHLSLANPRPLAEPIPFKGGLGLRRLDDATRIRVEAVA